MKRHKVSVSVEGRTIRVSPDPLKMTSEDEIHWACESPQRITVEFDGAGPFATKKLGHDTAAAPQKPRARGRFKYTVALESDSTVMLDPEVIVGDPPSKPGP